MAKISIIISCHDGTQYATEVEKFDAKELADQLNDESAYQIAIGDVVLHKSSVARVVKA